MSTGAAVATMNSLVQLAASYGLIMVLGLAAGAAATGMGFRLLRPSLRRTAPASRIAMLLALAVIPPLSALLLAVSMSAPWSTLGAEAWAHCASHADGHRAICGWHPPQLQLPLWLASVILLFALLFARPAIRSIWRLAAAHSRVAMLHRMATRTRHGDYFSLPTSQPLAFAAGFPRAQVFISKGLKRALSDAQMRIVIAHEWAHVRRRDLAVTMVVDVLSRLHWPTVGQALRSEWRLAIEQRCDEIVAADVGDRADVADCLVRMARLQKSGDWQIGLTACRLLDSDLTARVTTLLAPPAPGRPDLLIGFGLLHTLTAALLLLAGTQLHRWAELLLPVAG